MLETKICTKCNCEKELTEFGKNKYSKDSLQYYCKQCRNSIEKIKRQNPDSNHKEILRKSYKKHKEKRIQEKSKYRELNRKLLADKQKEYYRENKEDCIEYQKKYRIEKKDIIKEKHKEYMKKDFAKISKRNSEHKRRTLTKSGDVSAIEFKELLDNAKVCYWCNKKLIGNKKQVDHYVALSKGGLHTITNLVVACSECNLKKHAKDPYEFANERGRLL